ncbi:B3 domain-containing protein At3g25182-like [Tripterygium wilfordii]|uniref:B3 domain-containing protein At3g25182-like n=1 Tax=Tripterygium wilfordii TaxID=458696 RepID=UPI0018F83495|nr:B3 domain-containing protein At3g25182-like [Tripterygium wilfordii]
MAEPDLPQEFRQRIMELEGIDIVLVLQKELFKADVSKDQTRFSISKNQVKNMFLITDQEMRIHKHDAKKWMTIEVLLIEPDLQESRLNLKIWDMKKVSGSSNSPYVLVGGWYPIAKRNDLKVNDLVQLWAF